MRAGCWQESFSAARLCLECKHVTKCENASVCTMQTRSFVLVLRVRNLMMSQVSLSRFCGRAGGQRRGLTAWKWEKWCALSQNQEELGAFFKVKLCWRPLLRNEWQKYTLLQTFRKHAWKWAMHFPSWAWDGGEKIKMMHFYAWNIIFVFKENWWK